MKRNVKMMSASLLAGFALLAFASCRTNAPEKEEVKINLNQSMIEMSVGETYELKVTISPADPQNKVVVWKSSDDGVASVDRGIVTAKSEGEAVISAATNGVSDSCKVTVKPAKNENDDKPDDVPEEKPEEKPSAPEGDTETPDGNNPETPGEPDKPADADYSQKNDGKNKR